MVLNGVDSHHFSEIAPQGVKTATGAKGLNRHFGAETALLNLQCSIYYIAVAILLLPPQSFLLKQRTAVFSGVTSIRFVLSIFPIFFFFCLASH